MSAKRELDRSTKRGLLYGLLTVSLGAGAFGFANSALPDFLAVSYTQSISAASSTAPVVVAKESKSVAVHLPTPTPLKAIYMSQCVVGTPSFRTELAEFIEDTELNAVMIDVKDYTGKIAFQTNNPLLAESVSDACGAVDMRSYIEMLHQKGIYVIARITVFQDPYYAKNHPEVAVQRAGGGVWKDFKGLAFVDVGAKQFWDYIVELGKESYALGFDELNFDYVRFPSDGPMSEAVFSHSLGKSKPGSLEEFFQYLSDKLRPTGAVLSVDLFGMTATTEYDLNIGQVLERALPYFDGIYPMVYPSHYPKGFNGLGDPNAHTYEIIKYAMDTAIARALATTTSVEGLQHERIGTSTPALYSKPVYSKDKIRPWLQSFDYPVDYTPEMVQKQIQATYDSGLDSWLFWDAGNKYLSLRSVLQQQ
jgi:hypothetical protein